MDTLSDPEMIKLLALAGAFVIGVVVCMFVAVKETVELSRRRRARKLMYEDAVRREVRRKKMEQRAKEEEDADPAANGQSFA